MAKKKKSKIKRLLITLLFLIIIFLVLCFITPAENEERITADGEIRGLELPAPIEGNQIIKHTGYTLSYNEEYEVPAYVAYELTKDEVLGGEMTVSRLMRVFVQVLRSLMIIKDLAMTGAIWHRRQISNGLVKR